MTLQRIYTRTGDKGLTGLASGERVLKDSKRIETYGTVDELNAVLGLCREHFDELSSESGALLRRWFEAFQNDLFNIGSDLATPVAARWKNMHIVGGEEIQVLEKLIDRCQSEVSVLREFVLPGGSKLNAALHLARTVCRRAERCAVTLMQAEEINTDAVVYLNRFSDFLFVLSRWVLAQSGAVEVKWQKDKGLRYLNET